MDVGDGWKSLLQPGRMELLPFEGEATAVVMGLHKTKYYSMG